MFGRQIPIAASRWWTIWLIDVRLNRWLFFG